VTTKNRLLAIVAAVPVALFILLSVKHAREFKGFVLDADTGRPLSGVVLVMSWDLFGGVEGGNYYGPIKVSETVTDEAGAFRFKGWWRVIPPSLMLKTAPELQDHLALFKPGFDTLGEGALSQDRRTMTIRLKRVAGSDEDYSKKVSMVEEGLHETLTTGILRCAGRQAPEMLKALARQDRSFVAAGIQHEGIGRYFAEDARNPNLVAQHCEDIIGLVSGNAS
jgi:hypothetical protein